MDDLAGKLMELLSNKENMENIKSLSSLISANIENSDEKSEAKTAEKSITPPKSQTEESQSDIIPIDAIQTVMKLMPVLSSINKEDDNTRLLTALRPHLSEKRQAKLDESMKMMQMFKVLPVLKSQEIF